MLFLWHPDFNWQPIVYIAHQTRKVEAKELLVILDHLFVLYNNVGVDHNLQFNHLDSDILQHQAVLQTDVDCAVWRYRVLGLLLID